MTSFGNSLEHSSWGSSMTLENAPSVSNAVEDEDDVEVCDVCDAKQSFVLYEHDKVCKECGFTPSGDDTSQYEQETWDDWWEHRRNQYSGFYGDERVKMVGGFARPYET